jgi:hypothetical protein
MWEEAMNSAPWLETMGAKWFHQTAEGDYEFDGYKGGVNLTKDQMTSMYKLGVEKVHTLKRHLEKDQQEVAGRMGNIGGNSPSGTSTSTSTSTSASAAPAPHSHVFNSARWRKANPRGDVDAAINQAIAQGYEVQ